MQSLLISFDGTFKTFSKKSDELIVLFRQICSDLCVPVANNTIRSNHFFLFYTNVSVFEGWFHKSAVGNFRCLFQGQVTHLEM